MTPFSFEWLWNIEYFIFMGLLYLALTVIGCGLVYCLVKTWLDLSVTQEHAEPPEALSYRSRYSEY
ncbi:MAG: hypothetical protein HQ551_12200 [Desulfobacteraceae bacterium]|nr:hypothetical protein [Desulfobacteraceae bacterium]